MIKDKFVFIFVSPNEVAFMEQFFVINHTLQLTKKEKRFMVSGGDCNPRINK